MCAQDVEPIPAAVDPVGALLAQVGQLTGQRDRAYRTLRAIERYCEPASGRVLSGRIAGMIERGIEPDLEDYTAVFCGAHSESD